MANYTSTHTGVQIDDAVDKVKAISYGVCNGSGTTLTVNIPDYLLIAGNPVSIKFTNAISANATLNITSKGAKPIFHNGAAVKAGVIMAGQTVSLIYDGTNYNVIGVGSDIKIDGTNVSSLDITYDTASKKIIIK